MFMVVVLIMVGDDTMISFSLFSSADRGIRLIMNAAVKEFFVSFRLWLCFSIIFVVVMIRMINVVIINVGVIVFISTTWICTKGFGS